MVAEFGEGIVDQDGNIDRKTLGPIVFGDKVRDMEGACVNTLCGCA